MSIIFAGAPMVNAIVSTTKENNWGNVKPLFLLGIAMAAGGGYLLTKHAPKPDKTPPSEGVSKA